MTFTVYGLRRGEPIQCCSPTAVDIMQLCYTFILYILFYKCILLLLFKGKPIFIKRESTVDKCIFCVYSEQKCLVKKIYIYAIIIYRYIIHLINKLSMIDDSRTIFIQK